MSGQRQFEPRTILIVDEWRIGVGYQENKDVLNEILLKH